MSSTEQKTYDELFEHSKKIHILHGVISLLDWDQETQMPENASEGRAEQLKLLSGMVHKEKLSRKFADPLAKLIDLKTGALLAHTLSDPQKSAIKEWRRTYLIDKSQPKKFVENFTALTCRSMDVWKKARKEKNFKLFLPYLKKVIEANRKKADYIGFKDHPYDALLDLYEPGMKTETVKKIFDELKAFLIPLIRKIRSRPQIDDSILNGEYPKEQQIALCRNLLEKMGFDWKRERLDLSTHPFCSMSQPDDCRITTRILDHYLFSCILTVLHEAGHALYDLGLPKEQFGSPLAEGVSMGIHESQSRLWETRIGLSLPFWKFLLPEIKKQFPRALQKATAEEVYRAVNKVEPSFIRVESDEVTYPLHIILRFELEKKLIEGSLQAKEVPEAWNALMKEYLGITPPDDAMGCLQDVHWSMGAFGYFPTYALGNLYAGQIFAHFAKTHPDWEKRVEKGDFGFIRSYLHENVYRHGRRFRSEELIQNITGKPFSPKDYMAYLEAKHGST